MCIYSRVRGSGIGYLVGLELVTHVFACIASVTHVFVGPPITGNSSSATSSGNVSSNTSRSSSSSNISSSTTRTGSSSRSNSVTRR